jgi:hypothetical protein
MAEIDPLDNVDSEIWNVMASAGLYRRRVSSSLISASTLAMPTLPPNSSSLNVLAPTPSCAGSVSKGGSRIAFDPGDLQVQSHMRKKKRPDTRGAAADIWAQAALSHQQERIDASANTTIWSNFELCQSTSGGMLKFTRTSDRLGGLFGERRMANSEQVAVHKRYH